jgi:ADP-ribose pyrophosphatase
MKGGYFMKNEEWKILNSKIEYQERITVVKDHLLTPKNLEMDYIYIHPANYCAAAMLAFTSDMRVVLTHQYRHPLRKMVLDLPAGGVKKDEDPKQAALRELKEETGFEAKDIHSLGQFYPTPGLSSQIVHVFYAKSLKAGITSFDEHEAIDVVLIDWLELLNKVVVGEEAIDVTLAYAVMRYAICAMRKSV